MPITRPCDRCVAASCPQAKAVSATHPRRAGHVSECMQRAAAASSRADQARAPGNGTSTTSREPATAAASTSPPTVAAGRETRSARRNQ